MRFEDEIEIDAASDVVWELISDPAVLVNAVPGAKDVERVSETEYCGTIQRGVAGITIELDGEVELIELDAPTRLVADVSGRDQRTNSRMDATAAMTMAQVSAATVLQYEVDVDFSGRLASLGGRIVKRKINSDIKQFFGNIQEVVQEHQAVE